jgi:dTDP-4-dehydrorhamnose 3,5-epimerase-like enzyme
VSEQLHFSARDACLVQLELARDDRSLFAGTFCVEEFAAHALEAHWCRSQLPDLGSLTARFADGIRYDDPGFGINWPLPVTEVSEKDLRWPDFSR